MSASMTCGSLAGPNFKLGVSGLETFRVPKNPVRKNFLGAADSAPAAKKPRLAPAAGATPRPKAVVLDIEGTVAPISFVVETLFPYARARLASHLAATYAAPDTQAAIALFRQLVSRLRHVMSLRRVYVACSELD